MRRFGQKIFNDFHLYHKIKIFDLHLFLSILSRFPLSYSYVYHEMSGCDSMKKKKLINICIHYFEFIETHLSRLIDIISTNIRR